MKIRSLPAVGLFLCAPLAFAQPDRVNGRAFATRSPVLGQHGMVCTRQPLASQIGIDRLTAGGFMEPTGNGRGGDLFPIV
jgi:gamma-glutamyltranspeptidase/glutathione hydrolase